MDSSPARTGESGSAGSSHYPVGVKRRRVEGWAGLTQAGSPTRQRKTADFVRDDTLKAYDIGDFGHQFRHA